MILVLSGMHEVFMWCVGVEIHHLWNVGVPYSNQSSNFCYTNASQTTRGMSFNPKFFLKNTESSPIIFDACANSGYRRFN